MKVSYNWLKRYIDIDLGVEELSEMLTNTGLEVGGMEKFQSVKGGLEGIVIGEVLSCEKHPNADKLSLTTVDVGGETSLPIVCGAPNVAAGQKVVVALVGTKLYSGEESFEIKKAKIRGEVSEGMICAEDEIGLGSSHEGIMILDADAVPGTPAAEYFNITEDIVYEIDLTPNRTDATSHIGTARDIMAAINSQKGKDSIKLNIPSVEEFSAPSLNAEFPVIIEDEQACPRFSGITITGVDVKPSPEWMQNLLNAVGIRPINNVVDITNFVLMETGQPLHAYDTAAIGGGRVVVRKARKNEKFVTLDEVERELSEKDLMICDAEKGMCIAGVFGGDKTGVTENTRNVFLESAHFDAATIRNTAKHHGLSTDASFRFERGADINITLYAMKRAALLIEELAGGKVSSEVVDVYPNPLTGWEVELRLESLNKVVGQTIPNDTIKQILHDLDIEMLEDKGNSFLLKVPTYRYDVRREADVIEEVLRIYGYNNVDFPDGIKSSLTHHPKPDPDKLQNQLSDFLSSLGFSEIMNNSLTRASYAEKFDTIDSANTVTLQNPLSQDLNAMRQTLLFGGLENIAFNQNRKLTDIRFFEFGSIYWRDKKEEREPGLKGYHEKKRLALFICGRKQKESWDTADNESDFFLLKSYVYNLLHKLGCRADELTPEDADPKLFDEGLCMKLEKEAVVSFGKVSKKLLNSFEIKQDVYYANVSWDMIMRLAREARVVSAPVPKYPAVRRDLALLIDKDTSFGQIREIAFNTERDLLRSVGLFDVYEGKNIDADKKSYAVSFIFRDDEKTLTDKIIDKCMKRLLTAFEKEIHASIR